MTWVRNGLAIAARCRDCWGFTAVTTEPMWDGEGIRRWLDRGNELDAVTVAEFREGPLCRCSQAEALVAGADQQEQV